MKLEFEGILFIALKDKVVLSPKGSKTHLTFHSGPATKTFDLHLATDTPEGKKYKTLWAASHQSLPEMINKFAETESIRILRAYKRLNPSLLARQKITALVIYHPPESEHDLFTRKSRGRISIDKSKLIEKMWQADDLNSLHECEANEYFILYRTRGRGKPERIGGGFKYADRAGKSRLAWLPDHYLSSLIDRIRKGMAGTLRAINIDGSAHP